MWLPSRLSPSWSQQFQLTPKNFAITERLMVETHALEQNLGSDD
jgi:hypothetical protein